LYENPKAVPTRVPLALPPEGRLPNEIFEDEKVERLRRAILGFAVFGPRGGLCCLLLLGRLRAMKKITLAALLLLLPLSASAETPEEWITLGARVHGAFGAFIPLGIKIGLDAKKRLDAKPRELTVLYYDSDASPCACFADGIAIATQASVGQRTLTIASEKAPPGTAAAIVIRPRQGGAGFKYTIAMAALAKLSPMNKDLDPRGRYGAVMATEGLFQVEPIQ
jgi:FmdE, Molybdenum formylmethanofuran dehydrogenase operon